jgi:hypothetical protein
LGGINLIGWDQKIILKLISDQQLFRPPGVFIALANVSGETSRIILTMLTKFYPDSYRGCLSNSGMISHAIDDAT